MHLHPDESRQIVRLFGFLRHGEWLARDVATHQARLATMPIQQHFFSSQARQEAFHAAVFEGAVHWLAPRGAHPSAPRALEQYRTEVEAALARGDLDESVLALQVTFEALGETVLHAIDAGIERRGGGFKRLRRVLRAQEQAHHAFGARLLDDLAAGPDERQRLQRRAAIYLELVRQMFSALDDLFAHFGEQPGDYLADFQRRLPAWLSPT